MLVDFRVIWTPVIGVEGELADHLTTPASLMKYFAVIFFKKLAIPGPLPFMFVFSNKHYNAYGAGIRTHESPPITDQGSADVSNRRKLVGKKKNYLAQLGNVWEVFERLKLKYFYALLIKTYWRKV